MANNALTEDEVRSVLKCTGIPRMYNKPGYNGLPDINSNQAKNARILLIDRVPECTAATPLIMELSGDGKIPMEIFYGAVRLLVLRYNLPVKICDPLYLLESELPPDFHQRYRVLAISNLSEDHKLVGYLSPQMTYRLERFIRSWISNGGFILFNGGRPIKDSEMFSNGFINFLTNQDNYLFIPEDSKYDGRR